MEPSEQVCLLGTPSLTTSFSLEGLQFPLLLASRSIVIFKCNRTILAGNDGDLSKVGEGCNVMGKATKRMQPDFSH